MPHSALAELNSPNSRSVAEVLARGLAVLLHRTAAPSLLSTTSRQVRIRGGYGDDGPCADACALLLDLPTLSNCSALLGTGLFDCSRLRLDLWIHSRSQISNNLVTSDCITSHSPLDSLYLAQPHSNRKWRLERTSVSLRERRVSRKRSSTPSPARVSFAAGRKPRNRQLTWTDWYDIKAPSYFENRNVGKTLVNRSQGLSAYLAIGWKIFSGPMDGGRESHTDSAQRTPTTRSRAVSLRFRSPTSTTTRSSLSARSS